MPDSLPADILTAARTLWSFHRVDDDPVKADVIIGLGSYDIRVALRCAELYKAGFAPRILFTGGSGNWTRGVFDRPEADIFAEAAFADGVPPAAILVERQASNVGENLAFARAMVPDLGSAVLVTKPQTQKRVLAARLLQWPDIEAAVTAPRTGFDAQPTDMSGLRTGLRPGRRPKARSSAPPVSTAGPAWS